MMNLPQFLKSIDQTTAAMSRENLAEFIHDIARTLPEKEREDFLLRLDTISEIGTETKEHPKVQGADPKAPDHKAPDHKAANHKETSCKEDFIQKQNSLKTRLERIENWELSLEGCLNQDYDDWYNREEEEFLYSDPQGVLNILEEACGLVHQCIDCEEYEAACELTDILIGLDIMVDGEYQEYTDQPINIKDLEYYHLGHVNYRTLVIDAAHAAYCTAQLSERAQTLYDLLENSGRKDIFLEMIMQSGRELPEVDAFLPLWIEYLGGMTTAYAEKLLKEALELAGDGEQLLASARKYCGDHPELYEQYLSAGMGKTDALSLLAVGTEALEAIDKKFRVRSRVALMTARIALELGRPEEAERCLLEAFRSDTRVVNYLRLFMECRDFSKVREETGEIYRGACSRLKQDSYYNFTARDSKENQPNLIDAYMLAFLGGEFDYVRESAMNTKKALGWSASFMKCGLAAFLLLLTEVTDTTTDLSLPDIKPSNGRASALPSSGSNSPNARAVAATTLNAMPCGAREMLRQVRAAAGFSKAEYEKGTLKDIAESDDEWFRKCWLHWRKTISLSAEKRDELLQWTEKLVTLRTKGIMEGNHRKYYGECAAYIAALGEAKEAGGERNAKQITMAKYMEAYSRRSSFRGEMRAFGMRDLRKK